MRKELCDIRREAMIADLIMSSTVYEDLLTKVNRGRQFYDKLESKVKHLLERSHRVCKTEQEERSRIRERLTPKGIDVLYLFALPLPPVVLVLQPLHWPAVWNALPSGIRNSSYTNSFHRLVKTHCFRQAFGSP